MPWSKSKGLSPLTRQQQLKVGEKHRAFCIIYTSSTTHFINVNLTKSMSNAIEYTVEREKNSKLLVSLSLGFYT